MPSIDVADILKRFGVLKGESSNGGVSDESAADAFLALMQDGAVCARFVEELFPEGIRPDQTFFDRLSELRLEFNYTRSGDEGIGLVWSHAMHSLGPYERQTLLTAFLSGSDVFEHLGSLWVVIRDHRFPTAFLAEWFTSLVHAVERDFLQEGAWTAIRTFCTSDPETALAVLRLLPLSTDATRVHIAAFMLGVLRTLALGADRSRGFRDAEAFFNDHTEAWFRGVVTWSWTATAQQRPMTQAELAALFSRAERSPEDRSAVVCVACQLLIIAADGGGDIARACRQWIDGQVSPALMPDAKHAVVRAAQALLRRVATDEDILRVACCWLISVHPVAPDCVGTWQAVGATLCDILKNSRERFVETFERLCETSAATLQRLLRERQFQRLHTEMHRAGVADLVGRLCVSPEMETRRLGLYLFDSLEIPAFPQAAFSCSSIAARLLFYETQRVVLSPKTIARLLIAVASSAEAAIEGFRQELLDELTLQSHNFAGECRAELTAQSTALPLVKDALGAVASYFTDLDRALKAGINGMEVAGHRRAVVAQRRRFSREVAKGAESHSTIFSFVKQTRLLYGCATSQFLGGVLSDRMPLAHTSVSMEMPLVDLCDPEEMAMRRVHASAAIDRLLGTSGDDTAQESSHG